MQVEITVITFPHPQTEKLFPSGNVFHLNVILLFVRKVVFVVVAVTPKEEVLSLLCVGSVGSLHTFICETNHECNVLWLGDGDFEPMDFHIPQAVEYLCRIRHVQSDGQVIEVADEFALLDLEESFVCLIDQV